MAYASWSVVFGEQPSATKWNILGTNDASFNDGTGIADGAITGQQLDSATIIYATSTPSGSSDSTGSWATWGSSTTIDVPTWANSAIVIATIQNYYNATSTTVGQVRVVIGSDTGTTSGKLGQTDVNSNGGQSFTWMDEITLTGTGSVTLKNEVIEVTGTGALRVDTGSRFNWHITFLKV